jgi:hypothetical protein
MMLLARRNILTYLQQLGPLLVPAGVSQQVFGIPGGIALASGIGRHERYRIAFSAAVEAATPSAVSLESASLLMEIALPDVGGYWQRYLPLNPNGLTALADGMTLIGETEIRTDRLFALAGMPMNMPLIGVVVLELNNTSSGGVNVQLNAINVDIEYSLYDGPEYDL